MGADQFQQSGFGRNLNSAFSAAVEEALYQYGHAGYTGSLAEKGSVVLINVPQSEFAGDLPTLEEACAYADKLIDECDKRIDNKWGPAGAIQYQPDPKPTGKGSRTNKYYLFFGWASS